MMWKRIVMLVLLFCMGYAGHIDAYSYRYQSTITAATLEGTWMDRNGNRLLITSMDYGKTNYTIRDILHQGDRTIIILSLLGGRFIKEIYFTNDNPNYYMVKSFQNGQLTYNDYTRVK